MSLCQRRTLRCGSAAVSNALKSTLAVFSMFTLLLLLQLTSLSGLPTTSGTGSSRSKCLQLKDYTVIDASPMRTPLVVADHVIPEVRGKVVFEVGTRNGDILKCLSHFATFTYSAEVDKNYCDKLRERELNVICDDFMKIDLKVLSNTPDVFFWWPNKAAEQNEMWLEQARAQVKMFPSSRRKAIIAFDHQWPQDMANKMYMLDKYPRAQEFVIDFDEGTGERQHGKFSLVHFPLDD